MDKNLEVNQGENVSVNKSAVSSLSDPIDIPSSPARLTSSRLSPRDSLESFEEGEEGRVILKC